MPTPLSPHLIDDSLAALSGWTGDTTSISRTIQLDTPDEVVNLIASVDESARSLNHAPVVERAGNAVTFTLSTEEIGGVSEVDITLAARIDNLAGRLAGAPPTPAPNTAIEGNDDSAAVEVVDREVPGSGGPVVGVSSVGGDGQVRPGVALPDSRPGHPQPGVETEQGPPRA